MRRFIVYGLRDPRTGEVRYVGKSINGTERPRQHVRASSLASSASTYKNSWLKQLVGSGLKPEIVILQECQTSEELLGAEKAWIVIGRQALGRRLTNLTHGGDGCAEPLRSPETRGKMRAARLDPKKKSAHDAAIRDALNRSDVKERHRAAVKEAQNRPGVRANNSQKQKEVQNDPKVKAKHKAVVVRFDWSDR